MTLEVRAQALEPLGLTPRQARFLALVADHGGYCLRRQYAAWAGIRYGKNVCAFLDGLVAREFAERFTLRADRGHLYHLHARTVYRLLGQPESRHRRAASAALIARRLMLLDTVLAHADWHWLATEQDKVDTLVERFHVPLVDLPAFVLPSATPSSTSVVKRFPQALPIALAGDPPVVTLVVLMTGADPLSLARFLDAHAALLPHLPRWTVLAVAPRADLLAPCRDVFARFLARAPLDPRTSEEVRWYFGAKVAVEAGDIARLSMSDVERFRRLRARFALPRIDTLYQAWRARGEDAFSADVSTRASTDRPTVGQLVTDVLPFEYQQFGTLPGVA